MPETTSMASILMFAVAALIGAVGQYLYKTGAQSARPGWLGYLLNLPLWGGVICYVAVMVLFVAAFKKGGALQVLYPVYASTFIWSAFIALLAYGTPIKIENIGGMILLLAGMYLMGR